FGSDVSARQAAAQATLRNKNPRCARGGRFILSATALSIALWLLIRLGRFGSAGGGASDVTQ
ncbi:MAG: hypothetical protein IKD80_03345, partial [Selenomonadaceae bacterium]|nr:hypothetical protein [Selenomonadaceae bacterium]